MNCVLYSEEIVGQLPEYIDLAKSVGASGIFLMKFQTERKSFGEILDWTIKPGTLDSLKRRAKEKGILLLGATSNLPRYEECYSPYIYPYVVLGGYVYGCSYMANMRNAEVYMDQVIPVESKNYIMGNINTKSMKDIWYGPDYRELRSFLKSTRRLQGTCMTREGLLEKKLNTIGRFGFCEYCLCRWNEGGQ
jgi:hypothetical protein